MDYKKVLENKEVKAFLKKGNENLGILGYTDHSEKHCAIVEKRAGEILEKFGYSKHEIELAQTAGALHDIGNAINRKNHGEYGALLANELLQKMGMSLEDRVNYAVTNATVKLNPEKHVITLDLEIDESICTMYEYFEIFLGRMMMCRQAAELLGAKFKLLANGSKIL